MTDKGLLSHRKQVIILTLTGLSVQVGHCFGPLYIKKHNGIDVYIHMENLGDKQMKLIKTVDAEGAVLCHDITQIIRGVTKDAVFRKGHIVTKEDIPVLLSVGKDDDRHPPWQFCREER